VKWQTGQGWYHTYTYSILLLKQPASHHIYVNNGSQNPPTLIIGVHNKISTVKSSVSEPQYSGFTPFMVLIYKPLCQLLVTSSEKSVWDPLAHEFTSLTVLLLYRPSVAQSGSCIKWGWLLSCFMKLQLLSIM
jgi:hypothetical protein